MKTSFYLSEEAREAYKKIPRTVSVSQIIKWLLIAIVTPEKEFLKMRDADPEALEVRDYLRGKIEKLIK